MNLSIEPSAIAIGISIVTFISGVISHFFVVIKKQVEMETRLKQVEKDVVDLKKHIPQMTQRINDVHNVVSRVDAHVSALKDYLNK